MRKLLVFVMSVAMLVGCMTIGKKFDPNRVKELSPGTSTSDDAKAILGLPTSESRNANDSVLLQWQYVTGTIIGGNGAHVAILFGADGKMIRVTQKSVQ